MDDQAADVRHQWLERARDFWRERRSGMTAVRKLICNVVVDKKDSFDAETLLQECRQQDGLISLSTIYRTLKHLVEAELLVEIEGMEDKRLFRVKHGSDIGDSTVFCNDCKEVFPVENPCLVLREGEIARSMGFTPKRMSLRLETSCDELKLTGKCTRSDKASDKANGA